MEFYKEFGFKPGLINMDNHNYRPKWKGKGSDECGGSAEKR